MSKNVFAPVILGTAVALSGCGDEKKQQNVESCSLDWNFSYPDAKDPNKTHIHLPGLLLPVVSDCSTALKDILEIDGAISYGRSHSLTNPSTGSVVAAKNLPDQEAVESFVNRINPPIDTGEFVRPYYSPSQGAVVNIQSGSKVHATASPEGQLEGGDISLIKETPQNKGNAAIAKMRAQGIALAIKKTLEQGGVRVNGFENIKLSSSPTYFQEGNKQSDQEFGELYKIGLNLYGNGTNQVMQVISDYNTKKLPPNTDLEPFKRIIDTKRKAEVSLAFTAEGTQRHVDISNWSYAYLLSVLGLIGTAGVRKLRKNKQENSQYSV